MKLVIDIPDEIYKILTEYQVLPENIDLEYFVIHGTPLPTGIERLIDKDHMIARLEAASKFYGGENADAFDERFSHGLKEAAIKVAEEPTIIEADKERIKLTCDRNICLKNEYNNIGCEDCVVTKGGTE